MPGALVGCPTLHFYDKVEDRFDDVSVDDFLAETDVHSAEVEAGFGKIEGPAAEAALKLAKFAKPLPPGLYAVVGPDERVRTSGPPLADMGRNLSRGHRARTDTRSAHCPQKFFPVTALENPEDAARAINRLMWRSAGRYVLAKDRADLDAAPSVIKDDVRQETIRVDLDSGKVAETATREVERVANYVVWMLRLPAWHWQECRLAFGYPGLLIQSSNPMPFVYEAG